MAIRNWHFGKIVLLWVCGLFPAGGLWILGTGGFGYSLSNDGIVIVLATVLFAIAILVPVTWKWLSGKEKRD